MSEIKDILEKMKLNGHEYHDLRLLIAKRVWLIIASLYYLSYLFTVGGFYIASITIDVLSMIRFHLYSVLVIASVWFFYSLCEYGVMVYMPNRKPLMYVGLVLASIVGAGILLVHLGFIGK